jgi:leukotriene-A4 hydrolase
MTKARDPNTLSNYDKVRIRETVLRLGIDFCRKQLNGSVHHELEWLEETDEIILDTSFLKIHELKVENKRQRWELLERVEPYGSPLKISLDRAMPRGHRSSVIVRFSYSL